MEVPGPEVLDSDTFCLQTLSLRIDHTEIYVMEILPRSTVLIMAIRLVGRGNCAEALTAVHMVQEFT